MQHMVCPAHRLSGNQSLTNGVVIGHEKDFSFTNCMVRPNPEAQRSIPDEVSALLLWTTQMHVRCIEPTRNRLLHQL